VALAGVPFHNLSAAAALARLAEMALGTEPRFVATANPARLVRAQRSPDLLHSLVDADMVLCDSHALRFASRWVGNPLPQRIRHTAVSDGVLRLAATHGLRVFLLFGGVDGSAEAIARHYPGLQLAGAAQVEGELGRELEQRIRASRARLLVAWSDQHPLEPWLASLHSRLGTALCLHLVASQPVTSAMANARGTMAERWSLRLRHALALVPRLWRQHQATVVPAGVQPPHRLARNTPDWIDLDAGECLTRAAFDQQPEIWQQPPGADAHYAIDVSRVRQVDATGLALLARARREVTRTGRHFVLAGLASALREALQEAHLLEVFELAPTLDDAHALAPSPRIGVIPGLTRALAWCGEIVAANVEDVWQTTSEYVQTFAAAGATLVIVDLARLRFADTAGASLMVRVKRWARELKLEIMFVHLQPQVHSVLRLAAADTLVLEGGQ
jgi:N-acetylglucosaminyldiphosphoundecaprenol N-acetyl-beta-D-mannosaminyltransferase